MFSPQSSESCRHSKQTQECAIYPYEYVGYVDLPAVTVSCFWINHIESRVGVVTSHFGRQMHCFYSSFSVSFNKCVKTRLSSVRLSSLSCVRQ